MKQIRPRALLNVFSLKKKKKKMIEINFIIMWDNIHFSSVIDHHGKTPC